MGLYIRQSKPVESMQELLANGLRRCKDHPEKSRRALVRFPVGIFFARGDREGEGKNIASQLVSSFQYWNEESRDSFDFIYAGWRPVENDKPKFSLDDFMLFKNEFETFSTWKYSGETDLVILNFAVVPSELRGHFECEEVICLPIEKMLRKKMIDSVDGFAQQLFTYAHLVAAQVTDSPARALSDAMGLAEGRAAIWDALLAMALQQYKDKLLSISHRAVHNYARKGGAPRVEVKRPEWAASEPTT